MSKNKKRKVSMFVYKERCRDQFRIYYVTLCLDNEYITPI